MAPKSGVDCLRIVMMGKTGSGKSASANTILGRKGFKASVSQTSVTRDSEKEWSMIDDRPLAVVDTPGLFDSTLSNDEVRKEMGKCMIYLAPGPHVFLLVLQIGRFTPEEKQTVELIKKAFGEGAEKFIIILLTHGDNLEDEELTIEEYIRDKCDAEFKKFLHDCGGRYHTFNNKEKKDRTQVKELIKKIDEMVMENGGDCYTNDMLQKAEEAIKEEEERVRKEKEEKMRKEREEIEEIFKKEQEEMKKQFEKEREERMAQLQNMEDKIKAEQELREKAEEMRREQEERNQRELRELERKHEEEVRRTAEENVSEQPNIFKLIVEGIVEGIVDIFTGKLLRKGIFK